MYGSTAPFTDIVTYYRTQLDEKGNLVFKEPIPTHMFEVGRFREETMAFPPGVTVKDWTWGGSLGYPNPKTRRAAGAVPDDHHDRAATARGSCGRTGPLTQGPEILRRAEASASAM